MPRFVLPVEGLTVAAPWRLGGLLLHDRAGVERVVDEYLRSERDRDPECLPPAFLESIERLRAACLAEVDAPTVLDAVGRLADVVDVLRVFQYWLANSRTTAFGLAGDVRLARITYLRLGVAAGAGFLDDGALLGYAFTAEAQERLHGSLFGRAAGLAGKDGGEPGEARLKLAFLLLARATREHRPSLRQLGTIIAVETLLGGRAGKYALARRAAYFTCGLADDDLCGRARPACHFLTLDARDRPSLRALRRYTDQARQDVRARCSEWLDFLDRYDDRSGVAHGDPDTVVSAGDADKDLWWAVKNLLVPAGTWLLEHPREPAEDLDRALGVLGTDDDPA